jgi:hypothetical protein
VKLNDMEVVRQQMPRVEYLNSNGRYVCWT